MKRIILTLTIVFSLSLFNSCEKEDQVVLDMSETTAPEILSPDDGGSYVLSRGNAAEVFATFEWTEASYELDEIPKIRYMVQVDFADSLFKNARDLANTSDLEVDVTVGTLNQRLIALGAEPNSEMDFEFRVFSFLSRDATYTHAHSEEITLSITPYEDVVGDNPIYLLGSASEVGWDNENALELTNVGPSEYEIVAFIDGEFIKFISVLGQWAPQWGIDSGDEWEGTLSYRPTEEVPDPDPIDVSALDPGDYRIFADTAALQYRITPATMELYVMGTATDAGEDYSEALAMERISAGKYSITTELDADETLFFIEQQGEELPMYGTNETGTWEEGTLVFQFEADDPDPVLIPSPPASGEYVIEVNLSTRTYTITAN